MARLSNRAGPISAWTTLGLVAIGVMALPEPATFGVRGPIAAILVVLALALAVVSWRARAFVRIFLSIALCGWVGWQSAQPQRDLAAILADPAPDIGRHFVVGYVDADLVRRLSRSGLIGGVFLTRRNVANRSAETVAAEIASFQDAAKAGDFPPLVVAADQEGGPVSHLSPPLPDPPSLSTLANLPARERETAARDLGRSMGAALHRIGVTMDLAPVVDLRPAEAPGLLDLHTRIATRSISADPRVVAEIATGFSQGLLDEDVTPVAKHFPGLGSVRADTHLFDAANEKSVAALMGADWTPFAAMTHIPGAAVMVSHVALTAVDAGVPASRSRPIVQDILRERLGFGGSIITDDLTMGAVVHSGLCRAVEGAFRAGIDLLLVSWDIDKVPTAVRCALDAAHAGRLGTHPGGHPVATRIQSAQP